jgi:hypothetical protein
LPIGTTSLLLAAAALAVGVGVLLARRRAICATTLASAWHWTLAALAAWAGIEIAAGLASVQPAASWLPALRLAAVALSFCPVVSLIGAKRPQHAAWNFVVVSLWGIVSLPAAEALLLQRGPQLEMGAARGWFLWVLIALAPINFVPTRFWLAALLAAAGQVVAMSPHLALIRRPLVAQSSSAGLLLCIVGLVAAWHASRRQAAALVAYDRLWLDFRDTFGLFWALRVQERVNAAARQFGWEFELAWAGFVRRADGQRLEAIDPAIERTLRTTLRGLLRRFVSGDWIAERLGEESSQSPTTGG